MSHLGSLCSNGPRGGMRPGSCDDAIMFGPWVQWDRGFFGPYKLYKRSGVQSPPTQKTDRCLGLMIKSYQEQTP